MPMFCDFSCILFCANSDCWSKGAFDRVELMDEFTYDRSGRMLLCCAADYNYLYIGIDMTCVIGYDGFINSLSLASFSSVALSVFYLLFAFINSKEEVTVL